MQGQMQFGPFFGMGMNPMFFAPNVMGGWTGIYNNNNMANNIKSNMPQSNNIINAIFKTTNGKVINIQVGSEKTVGELICIFLKRMGSEHLIGNEKDICFLNNATKLKYDDKRKVLEVFKMTSPTIMVNDVQNLIGAF